jgi:hypothetical protein
VIDPLLEPLLPPVETPPPLLLDPGRLPDPEPLLAIPPPDPVPLEVPMHTPPRGTHAFTVCPLDVASGMHAWSAEHPPPDGHVAAQ